MLLRPFRLWLHSWFESWTPPDQSNVLAGSGAAIPTATGALGIAIPLTGQAALVSTATGDIGFPTSLGGAAAIITLASGTLSGGSIPMAEQLSGNTQVSATATGNLDTNDIAGAALVVSTVHGAITINTLLSSAAVARAIASGNPSVLVPLGASAVTTETVTGAVAGNISISGNAKDIASATAIVNMLQSFTGSAASRAAAVASLTIGANLAGNAAAVGTTTGALNVGISLDADAEAKVAALGATGVSTSLAGQASVEMTATSTLKDLSTPVSGPCYAVNLTTGAVTTLSNFGFEKLTRAHAALYGLKSGTVYQLTGDTDPGPIGIEVTMRFAPLVMPTMHLYRLHYMYIRAREVDGITAIPLYDETVGYRYDTVADEREGLRVTKVNTGNGNSWHSLGLIIKNKNGGKLDLAGVEFITSQLVRRSK